MGCFRQFAWLALVVCPGAARLWALSPHKALTQYTRSIWTQAQGLPQDTIRAITQTPDGYLWLGTNEGLARFDGYDFVSFTKDGGSLPSNTVNELYAGKNGTLWIATSGGLTRYHDGRFKTFTAADGLPPRGISSMVEDHDGVLWLTSGGILKNYADGKFTTIPKEELGPVQVAQVVYEDPQHTLWVTGVGGLIKKVDKHNHFEPVLTADQLGDNFITEMVRGTAGIWLGGNRGILLLQNDGTRKRFDEHDGLPSILIRALLSDHDGNLWAGTNGGLSRYENGRFVTPPRENKDDANDWVWSLFEDRENDLWVGMNSSLNRLRDDPFLTYGRTEGLPSDQPITVHQDRGGTIWVGFHDAGMAALPTARSVTDPTWAAPGHIYTTKDGLPSNEIFSIRDARDGDLLIATRGGLSRMHDGRFSSYTIRDPLGRTVVYDSLEDSQGRLWAALPNGVYLHPAGKNGNTGWQSVLEAGGRVSGIAVAFAESKDGSIWAGMFNYGLWKMTEGKNGPVKPQRFATSAQMGSDQLRSLYQDPDDGTLWIGTFGGGLNAVINGALHRFGVREGLLSDNISHVEDDGRGNLWLSTTRGICRVSKQELLDLTAGKISKLTPDNYGIGDGLRSAQVAPGFPSGGGGTRTSDGHLWFPTGLGLAGLDPNAIMRNAADRSAKNTTAIAPSPLVKIVEMVVDGNAVDFSQGAKLQPGTGRVQFRYTGIHLSGPEQVRYSSKLEGLESKWIPAGTRRIADYNPLPHGKYRFLVRAELPGGATSESNFAFEVLPYFYQTAAFFWLVGLTILGVVYGLYQLRLKQIRGRFGLVLDERARLAREIHDTLAQGFVGISSQLDALAVKLNGDLSEARQHLDLARKMARYSLTEARRSVTDLRTSELEEQGLPAALVAAANKWTSGSKVRVQVDVSGDPQDLSGDMEQNLLRIGQEAVANALKHARANMIRVELEMKTRAVCLRVKDDGQGFEPASAFSVMEGHFGILGMRERAERLGGKFHLASAVGAGTEVEVMVPLASKIAKRG